VKGKKKKRRKLRPKPSDSAVLEQFTVRDLEIWQTRSVDLQLYRDRIYFDLERQRASHYEQLVATLRDVPAISVNVDDWVRVTDWRWSLTPLSPEGSLKGVGGAIQYRR
jgi:hypothetical protein